MGHDMIKKITLIVVLIFAFAVSGCTQSSTTPSITSSTTASGWPCTSVSNVGCFYFISNGTAVACDVIDTSTQLNYCDNTSGEFYYDNNGLTVLCADHECETTTGVTTPSLCSAKFAYNNLANGGQAWEVVNQLEDQNTTQQSISTKFISTSATTISTSASFNLTVNIDAIIDVVFASVRAQINASVSRTESTVVGNEVTVTIPPGKTAYGIYGVSVQVTNGHLYQSNSCNGHLNYGEVRTYVPVAPGWCVWLSGQTPCRIV